VAAEVLADDDVCGQLAPEGGNLDVLLLEDADALLVADAGGPDLPIDLVVGVRPSGSMGATASSMTGIAACAVAAVADAASWVDVVAWVTDAVASVLLSAA
jgi:hypothetical protein